MTTTVQAPPPAAVPTTAATSGPPEGPRSRRWLVGFWAVMFVLFLVVHPGRQTFDTKLGVTTDPGAFLSDLGQLWHDQGGFGGIQDQYAGYLWPMLPFYWLAHLVHLPVWLAERLWMSLIVSVAFWGALRLAERLRVGSGGSRLLAGVAYALWPVFTIVVGSTSAAVLPGAFLPWVLLPLTNERYTARVAALRSALVVPFMGGVNGASTLASLLPVGLYLLSRPPGPRQRKLIAWWVPGVVVATAWWWIPLLMLGVYGENFLPYVETSQTTTATMSGTEALRGAGNWVAYLHFGQAWLPAGWTVAASVVVIVCSALAAGLGLAGLARRDMPERRWLVLTVVSCALVLLAGYGGAFGAPFHGLVQDWLNGWLVPFRNIYKFQTGLALALVFGIAHVVGVAAEPRGARPVRGRRFAPLVAAVLILPGLLWPYLNGSILNPGSFQQLPKYWDTTASWLQKYSPDSRALVVPATAHGIYSWGSPIDQPLDVLAKSRWAQRDYVPFGTPGNRRAMDAVENALASGSEVPGLADYLSRAGIYYVVVRNDLDPDQIGAVPTTTVKRTLQQSGYVRVTGFGPVMTGGKIAHDAPLQVEGLYPRQRAVEIYEPGGKDVPRPGQARLLPVSDTAVVSGGPEALLPLASELRDRPTVLTGDNTPGLGSPALRIVGDGLRRADTRFGLVSANTSYTYTSSERNAPDAVQDAGKEPHQILPTEGIAHQTVAQLRGARSVTGSSSGNWLFHLPQYDPVNAFDGNPGTAWAEGAPGSADGQWLRIGFTDSYDMPSSFKVTPLPQASVRSAATKVRVETERGSRTSFLRPNGQTQSVKAPAGATSWMKLTIVDAVRRHSGLTGAGFSEIALPHVQVTRLLRLPTDADNASDAAATQISLHRAPDPTGLSATGTEAGLHRRFTTATAGTYEVTAGAVPVSGAELDKLLYRVAPDQQNRIVATADSTAALGAGLSARNLTDGDLTTAWVAGDRPTIHLSWDGKQPVGEIVLAPAGGLSTRATQVNISSPDGATIAGVDENGVARFDPITTDRLDITITQTAPLTLHNPVADEDLQLPVGLSEAYIPALDQYRTPQPGPSHAFSLPCGQGPDVAVDGKLYATSVKGTVRDLVERRQVQVTLCQQGRKDTGLELTAGTHRVEAGDAGPLVLADVTLMRGTVSEPSSETRQLTERDWLGDRREVTVGSGGATYLTTYENYNDGWKATLGGKELTPVRLDGWQQGWRIPSGAGGTVKLSYEPATTYEGGLIGGAVGLAALIGLAVWRRRAPNPDAPQPVPPLPGLWLGTVALTGVAIVIAGWFALLVLALALLASRRHALLMPIAFAALAGAGIAAATGAGEPAGAGHGAFGHAAQLLALIGLFAGVVSVREPDEGPGHTAVLPPATEPALWAASEAPTRELPQRRRGERAAPGTGGTGADAAAPQTASDPPAERHEEGVFAGGPWEEWHGRSLPAESPWREQHEEGPSEEGSGQERHAEGTSEGGPRQERHEEGTSRGGSGQEGHEEGTSRGGSGQEGHEEGTSRGGSGQERHAEGTSRGGSGQERHAEGTSDASPRQERHAEGRSEASPRQDAGPVVSARGPGGAEPGAPTGRIPFRKPRLRATEPEPPQPQPPAPDDDTGRG